LTLYLEKMLHLMQRLPEL